MAATPQPGCTFTLAPPTLSPAVSGGPGAVAVTASSGVCNWPAWSTVPWITVSGNVGTGNGSFNYTVDANPGMARTGQLMIQGGQSVTVTQAGTRCDFTFDNVTPSGHPRQHDRGVFENRVGSHGSHQQRDGLVSPHAHVRCRSHRAISRSGCHDRQPERRERREREQLRQRLQSPHVADDVRRFGSQLHHARIRTLCRQLPAGDSRYRRSMASREWRPMARGS